MQGLREHEKYHPTSAALERSDSCGRVRASNNVLLNVSQQGVSTRQIQSLKDVILRQQLHWYGVHAEGVNSSGEEKDVVVSTVCLENFMRLPCTM